MTKITSPRRDEVITQKGGMVLRFAKFLEKITTNVNELENNSGSSTDIRASTGNSEEIAEDEAFFKQTLQAEVKEWNAVTPTNTYYAVAEDFVESQTGAIYLPEFPDINDQVIIASDYSGNVVIYGNTNGSANRIKVRDLESSVSITQKGNSYHFIYFGDYWRII